MKLRALLVVIGLAVASPLHAQQACQPHFNPANACHGNTSTTSYFPVCALASGYDPANLSSTYTSPRCNGGQSSYKALFDAVYKLLDHHRDDVNKKLCNLTNLFVTKDPNHKSDFGVWEVPAAPAVGAAPARPARGAGGVYIVVRDSVLASAKSLAAEENALLAVLLGLDPGSYPPKDKAKNPLLPYFDESPSPSNTPAAAVLAVLAHELGHVLLADANADDASPAGHSHPRPCAQPTNKCFDGAFLSSGGGNRWNNGQFYGRQRRWIGFGDQNQSKHRNTKIDFDKIQKQLHPSGGQAPNYKDATTAIHDIYDAGFVSVFEAVSPEEDFIEIYKYKVLADAGLHLTLKFPPSTFADIPDVLAAVRSPAGELPAKATCVNALTP